MRDLNFVELACINGGTCNCMCVETRRKDVTCMQWLAGLLIDGIGAYRKVETVKQGGCPTPPKSLATFNIGTAQNMNDCTQACRNRGQFLHSCVDIPK